MKANTILSIFIFIIIASFSTAPAFADGTETKTTTKTICTTTYGGGTECRDEVVTEEVVRDETPKEEIITEVDTGIAEVAIIAAALVLGGVGLFALAQNQLNA